MMIKRGCGINVIIEGLVVNRQGVITESAEEQVQKDIKSLLSNNNVPGRQKRNFYEILKTLYSLCNDAGPYKFLKGDTEHIKGGVDSSRDTNYEAPTINVTLTEMYYDIKFLSGVEIRVLFRRVRDAIKEMTDCYKSFNADSFAITLGFDDNDETGLYMAIEKASKALRVRIGYQEYIIESKTGFCGTEVGLPIDKENCESTDVGGVSTTTGGFSNDSKEKKKKVFPAIVEDEKENDEETEERPDRVTDEEGVERIVCPECQSINVNSDGSVLMCSDCSYMWTVDDEDDEEIKDHMVPQEDDIDASDYQNKYEYQNSNNSVECLQTQQNTDKSDLV